MKLIQNENNSVIVEVSQHVQILFSYSVPVALRIGDHCYKTSKKHSKTTNKHINDFIGKSKFQKQPQGWFDDLQMLGLNVYKTE